MSERIISEELWDDVGPNMACFCPRCDLVDVAGDNYESTLVGGKPDPNCFNHFKECKSCGQMYRFLHKLDTETRSKTACGYAVDGKLVKGEKECSCWPAKESLKE